MVRVEVVALLWEVVTLVVAMVAAWLEVEVVAVVSLKEVAVVAMMVVVAELQVEGSVAD